MAKFDLVVFDMAGTVIQDKNEVEMCFQQAADQTGLMTSPERIVSMMGWSKRLVFETLWKEQLKEGEKIEIEEKIEKSYALFKEILENHYRSNPVLPVEHCVHVFQKLKEAGVKIALTTGFYREVTNIILERLGWNLGLNKDYVQENGGIIDCSVTSDQVSNGRPSPYMIYRAMELTGTTNIKHVAKLGDTPSDLSAGKNAATGLNIGVTYGTHTKEQLSILPHDYLISSLDQLLKLVL